MKLIEGNLYYIPYGNTANKGNPKDVLGIGIFQEHGIDKFGEYWKFKDKMGTSKKSIVSEYRAYGEENIEYVNKTPIPKELEKIYYEMCPENKPKEDLKDIQSVISSVKENGKIESILKFIRQTFNYEGYEEKYEKLKIEYNKLVKENEELIKNIKNLEDLLEDIHDRISKKLNVIEL